jgi:hypothetical protein
MLVFHFVAKETLGLITSEMTTISFSFFEGKDAMKSSSPCCLLLKESNNGGRILNGIQIALEII